MSMSWDLNEIRVLVGAAAGHADSLVNGARVVLTTFRKFRETIFKATFPEI